MSEQQFVAVRECANGNASVGTEWVETAVFSPDATLAEVWDWSERNRCDKGRLMIQVDTGPAARDWEQF